MVVERAKQGKSALRILLALALVFPFPLWAGQASNPPTPSTDDAPILQTGKDSNALRLAQVRKHRSTRVQSIGGMEQLEKKAPPKAKAKPARSAPKESNLEKQVILLDVRIPSKYYKLRKSLYEAVLIQLEEAEALGTVAPRSAAGRGAKIQQILRTCGGIQKNACLMSYARKSRSAYAVVGDLIESGGKGVLGLWLFDVHTGKVLAETRRPLHDLGKADTIAEEATCELTVQYGCDYEGPATAAAPLQAAGDDAGASPPAEETPAIKSSETPQTQSSYKPWAWTTAGISAAALAGGAVMLGLTFTSYNDYLDAKTPAQARSKKSDVDTYSIVSYSLFGLSAAALGASIALFVLDDPGESAGTASNVSVVPALAPQGGGIVVQGQF